MDKQSVYEVGKYYVIPVVYAEFFSVVDWWPVLGPKHEDKEFIGFEHDHYHFDFRFFSDGLLKWLAKKDHSYIQAFPLTNQLDYPLGAPEYRRRKCQQPATVFNMRWGRIRWMPALRAAYQDYILKDDLICPHRGAPLATLPADADGCITCPLHGLQWNLETRRLADD